MVVRKGNLTLENNFYREAVEAELAHIRLLGSSDNLAYASSNLGAYEALLVIMQNAEHGIPVYKALTSVRTPFSGQSGIINRLRTMRNLGLLEEKPGAKKSQVCLIPSEKLMRDIYPVLAARYYGGLQE